HLKTLLLERNPIKMLPVELALHVTAITCVLYVNEQCKRGALYLTLKEDQHQALVAPVKKRTVSELPHPLLDSSEERVPDKEAIHSQEAKGTVLTEKAGFFPPVENLDLRERRRSTEPPEDWPSEEEIRRFWKLRQEIVGSEPAEVPESQRLPVELPPALKAVLRDKETRRPRPRPVFRTRTPSFKSVLPELAPRQQALGRTGLPEESRGLALRELREKQAQLEQRRSPGPSSGSLLFLYPSSPVNHPAHRSCLRKVA
ncbi:hypothetical protein E2I00_010767, partial [Balaenoptera physalus]